MPGSLRRDFAFLLHTLWLLAFIWDLELLCLMQQITDACTPPCNLMPRAGLLKVLATGVCLVPAAQWGQHSAHL